MDRCELWRASSARGRQRVADAASRGQSVAQLFHRCRSRTSAAHLARTSFWLGPTGASPGGHSSTTVRRRNGGICALREPGICRLGSSAPTCGSGPLTGSQFEAGGLRGPSARTSAAALEWGCVTVPITEGAPLGAGSEFKPAQATICWWRLLFGSQLARKAAFWVAKGALGGPKVLRNATEGLRLGPLTGPLPGPAETRRLQSVAFRA